MALVNFLGLLRKHLPNYKGITPIGLTPGVNPKKVISSLLWKYFCKIPKNWVELRKYLCGYQKITSIGLTPGDFLKDGALAVSWEYFS